MPPSPEFETSVARLTHTAEQLSILGHELAAATAAVWNELTPEPQPELDPAAAIATILQSTSDRMHEHVLSLIEIAYAQNEESIAASGDPRAERCAVALGRISRSLEPVFELAQELAGHLRAAHSVGIAHNRSLSSDDLTPLDAPIRELLSNTPMATGAGIAIAPGLLEDRELWMQWWVNSADEPTRLTFEFAPDRPRFYDYPTAVWYRDAARELTSQLADPHFDAGGTDRYMVTATTPAVVNSTYLGLGCAELTLEHLAQIVRPALAALGAPAALITPSGLVAASTDPGLIPSEPAPATLMAELSEAPREPFIQLGPGTTVARSSVIPWVLICTWPSAEPTPRP
jgi:hypothetical protein